MQTRAGNPPGPRSDVVRALPPSDVSQAGRWALGLGGLLMGFLGTLAVFASDNGPGTAALVAAGPALGALAVFANRLRSFEAAGLKVELATAAVTLESAARRLDDAGDPAAAKRVRAEAQDLMALASPLASRYRAAREAGNPRGVRIAEQERVVRQWSDLARSTSPDAASVAQLFRTGDPSLRIGALAMMSATPRLVDPEIVAEALRAPASSFEQFHALRVAETLVTERGLDPSAAMVGDVIRAELVAGRLGTSETDRRNLAERVLSMLDRPRGAQHP